MTPEEAKQRVEDSNEALARKGILLLTVKVDTPEEAHEILNWMYLDKKPMKATLLEIAWDKVAVPKAQADALETLRVALAT